MTRFGAWILGIAMGAVALAIVLNHTVASREAKLRAYGDSVVVASAQAQARATAYADSLRRKSDSLAHVQLTAEQASAKAALNAQTARGALAQARTMSDSNVALVRIVASQDAQIAGLTSALGAAKAQIATERLRGDSLDLALAASQRTIVGLNAQIQKLNAPSSFAIKALRYGSYGLAFVAGVEAAKKL